MRNLRLIRASALVAALAIGVTPLVSAPAFASIATVSASDTGTPTDTASPAPTDPSAPVPTDTASPAPTDSPTPTDLPTDPVVARPTISGVPAIGSQLTVDPGDWPADAVLSYQWYAYSPVTAKAAPIANATGTSINASPAGTRIRVDVTGTMPDGTSTTRSSAYTQRVGRTDTVQISGAAATGEQLTISIRTGYWTSGATFTYDWFADGTPIPDAHNIRFTPGASLAGTRITAQVTATSTGFPTLSNTSAATGPLLLAPTPVILDDPFVDHTLTVDPGTWSPGTDLAIEWRVGSTDIATGPTLAVTPAMYGERVSVRVTGTNPTLGTVIRGSRTTPPVATGSVDVTGNFAVGETVTATTGGWFSFTANTYQWLRDGVAIPGATASTYTIPATDENHVLVVRVTGTDSTSPYNPVTASLRSDAQGAVIRAGIPAFTSTPVVGRTATVNTGTWPAGTTFTYAWYVSGSQWIDYTGPSVVVPDSWVDRPVRVEVTATSPGYATVTESTATLYAVRIMKPTVYGTFAVSGTAEVDPGGYWRQGTTFTYQWMRNGVALAGQTHWWHDVTKADENTNLTVRVTAKVPGYGNVVQTTTSPGRVTTSSIPWINGTRAVGSTLTADPLGGWKRGTKLSYQWYEDGFVIRGATASHLVLTSALRGHSITVSVTGRLSGYATVTEVSAGTARIALAPTPTISGTRKVGSRLTANHGTWTSGTAFTYQWYANGHPITGATSSTFVLKSAQRGKTVTVKVTGKKSGYATISRMSAKTATIR